MLSPALGYGCGTLEVVGYFVTLLGVSVCGLIPLAQSSGTGAADARSG